MEYEFGPYLENATNMANALFALTQVHPNSLPSSGKTSKFCNYYAQHIDLLDAIALLLASSHETIATGLAHSANYMHTIYWAKTTPGPATEHESAYIARLEESIRRGDSPKATLAIVVVPMCREKIRKRVQKLGDALRGVGDETSSAPATNDTRYGVDTTSPAALSLQAHLTRKGLIEKTMSLAKLLQTLEDTTTTDPSALTDEELIQVIIIAYQLSLNDLGTTPKISDCVVKHETPPLYIYRMKKVGAYYHACWRIYREWNFPLQKHLGDEKKQGFRIEQIIAPDDTAMTVTHTADTVEALNQWARHTHPYSQHPHDHQIPNYKTLKHFYPHAKPGEPGSTHQTKTFQHCELTLALALYQRKKMKNLPGAVLIGCSQRSCRCAPSWQLPTAHPAIRRRTLNEIGLQMGGIFNRVNYHPTTEALEQLLDRLENEEAVGMQPFGT
ncbi:MAG: hypothetical protein Q9168_007822 [Polycauliona sp. 1 TL-2023]